MDLKSIQEIIRMVNKSDLTEVEIEQGDFKLRIKRRSEGGVIPPIVAPQMIQSVPAYTQPVIPATHVQETVVEHTQTTTTAPASNKIQIIRSPMIGTFYRAAGPDKEPFVKVGDSIRKKQVLCMIEAMKLFNEIESEVDGKIVKILVENAQPVEYDQPLFEVELA
jgi:acetyl-CoA carboxylase biotin carboxyl carrier protein